MIEKTKPTIQSRPGPMTVMKVTPQRINMAICSPSDIAACRLAKGFSLDIKKSEIIAVVGPSGCGKSSLMKLISGLHMASAGAVLVEDKQVKVDFVKMGLNIGATFLIDLVLGRHRSVKGFLSSEVASKISSALINTNFSKIISSVTKLLPQKLEQKNS